ncbi:hypothetical protein BH11GEM2_BH11GEM2_33420 [soil metagenome]
MKFVSLAVVVAACGGDDGGSGLAKASYRVDPFSSATDVGEVFAFNATGHLVSHSTTHGWTVIDVATRVFTQITAMTGFLGFDDSGELLYTADSGGPLRYFLRSGNGGGSETEIPRLLAGGIPFVPFALANDGGVWGVTLQAHQGETATPGYGRYAAGNVEEFRDWAGHAPTNDLGQIPFGVDAMRRAVFCETPGDNGQGNGLPQTHCRILTADNTPTELGRDVEGFWSISRLRPITPGGRLGGEVTVGNFGFGGSFPALFEGARTELLGVELGEVLALNDRGDVIFNQLHVSQPVRVRDAAGDVADLTDFLRDPTVPNREVTGLEVLALAPDGRILVKHGTDGTDANMTVDILTPR